MVEIKAALLNVRRFLALETDILSTSLSRCHGHTPLSLRPEKMESADHENRETYTTAD